MKKRAVFRIQISSEAKDRLLGITDRLGITQIAVASKLTEWFASQSKDVQSIIVAHESHPDRPELASVVLKQIASGKALRSRAGQRK